MTQKRQPDQKKMMPKKYSDVPKLYGDAPTFMGCPAVHKVDDLKGADAAILGIPFDGVATFRGGATRLAPQFIRKYSLLWGNYNLSIDLDISRNITLVDYGDVDIVPGNEAESYRRVEKRLSHILEAGAVPIGLGGDHGVSIPMVRAVAKTQKRKRFGVIIFDTHQDMVNDMQGNLLTRSSPTRRITELAQVDPRRTVIIGCRGPRNPEDGAILAKELGIVCISMDEVDEKGIEETTRQALAIACPEHDRPYVSIDIDVFDPGFAPATNSPDPGGLSPREMIKALRIVTKNGLLGLDIVEVAPEYDTTGGITSILASRIITEALGCLAQVKGEA